MSALLLAFLELTFVMVSILLLHSLKRTIGSAGFHLTLGMFFVLGQIVSSAKILIDPGLMGFQVNLGNTILLAPYMVAILIVYIVDGTLEAQRMILGLLAVLFGYFYLANITASQCAWSGYVAANPESSVYLESLFLQGRRVVAASFIAHGVDLFVLPIVFQLFHNRNTRLFFCVLGTLIMAQVIDSFVFQLIAMPQLSDWWVRLRTTYMARAGAMMWLSILTTIYLHMCKIPRGGGGRRPLDILIAFFGGYGRAQELQKYIREWEGRYSVVVQNSSDLIFIVDDGGIVLNANDAALEGLGHGPQLAGRHLTDLVRDGKGRALPWETVWGALSADGPEPQSALLHQDWETEAKQGKSMRLDVSVSGAELHEKPVAVVIARDVTERRRLELERERLQEELLHSQRMEAVGQLAGGVAHDFNNLLHTIQGSLDGIDKQPGLREPHKALLGNIDEATRRASSLTNQLLGFARKGKYRSEKLDVVDVMDSARALFEPVAGKGVEFKMIVAPTPMHILGDTTQLQQVFLNLLLNARDAVQDADRTGGRIVFRAEPAAAYTPGWESQTGDSRPPEAYTCVRIKDNGVGIPEELRANIFDPFFTTKEVGKGTGMGLAMAYGCVGNHNGWIHVESNLGRGTEFFIFFPLAL
ncbi:MAG: PAS domain S-box protein [Lentisphaerae bacterium]|nr:PAS domain S-box protein [Lentisphaerota bacterium]MBT4816294.1 PAS domain S-box protein [Lentisphaerota bacterium]MBT5610203.1 PAS domain S-box protein [Lentisphaerota bacterium]MBT7060023.1 PAS domain S-box protein [Lentisphaerota bacterium]MBT7840647.1 PAS domain S-box protein [Lentisphaerota bacterium]